MLEDDSGLNYVFGYYIILKFYVFGFVIDLKTALVMLICSSIINFFFHNTYFYESLF